MMQDPNVGFLGRQLVLTELPGGETVELEGGCLVKSGELWAGLWLLDALGDPERFIKRVQAEAASCGKRWAGTVALIPPGAEGSPLVKELSEALFVYGYPEARGRSGGGPDVVQILGKPPAPPSHEEIQLAQADGHDPQVQEFLRQATSSPEMIVGPAWATQDALSRLPRFLVAFTDDTPAGVIGVYDGPGGVIGRVVLLWVDPAHRGQGLGRTLIGETAAHSARQEQVLLSAWCPRDGTLRYYLQQLGFEDQLTALYYLAQTRA
jgi:ribosomal protein S18 acetylase RimI-like enzyme